MDKEEEEEMVRGLGGTDIAGPFVSWHHASRANAFFPPKESLTTKTGSTGGRKGRFIFHIRTRKRQSETELETRN